MSVLGRTQARSLASGLLLAIDTCAERCSAALLDRRDETVLAAVSPTIGRGHAEHLMGVIDAALGEAGATYADLSRLAVCVGPGSFTGIRVGVATARGLALSLGIPAVGITSLEALAEPWMRPDRTVLVVQDARRGEIFAALAVGTAFVGEPQALPPARLTEFCAPVAPGDELVLVGTGAAVAATILVGRDLTVADDSGAVDPGALARLGARRTDLAPPSPLYLRGPDAKPQARPALRVFNETDLH